MDRPVDLPGIPSCNDDIMTARSQFPGEEGDLEFGAPRDAGGTFFKNQVRMAGMEEDFQFCETFQSSEREIGFRPAKKIFSSCSSGGKEICK